MTIDPENEYQAEKIIDRLKYVSIEDRVSDELAKILQEEIDREVIAEMLAKLTNELKG